MNIDHDKAKAEIKKAEKKGSNMPVSRAGQVKTEHKTNTTKDKANDIER